MRVLGRVRLSRLTDESTSVERQRAIIETWAEQNEHTVIGWAEDLDVSGAVSPFDTHGLGPWLTQPKLSEWDILCAWKLDRLARRAVPLHKLFGLCQDEGKTLVCVSDNIDLSHWVGRLIASVIAGVAEGELEAIKERTRGSYKKLRETGRWPGGRPTYGYRPVQRPEGYGWTLAFDDDAAPVLRGIIDRVLSGERVETIARSLTVPNPADHYRIKTGREPKGTPWYGSTIRALLKSKTLLGHSTDDAGVTLRDSEGHPVLKAPALVTRQEYDQLQTMLESYGGWTTSGARLSPMSGVALCGVCEHPLHYRAQTKPNGSVFRYYLCRQPGCVNYSFRAEHVENLMEETFLSEVGGIPEQIEVFVPAESHQNELYEAIRAVDELSTLLGTITSTTMRSRLTEQMRALDSRILVLESLPSSDARWDTQDGDTTYAEAWESSDTDQRRALLLRSGIRGVFSKPNSVFEFHLRVPENLKARMTQKTPLSEVRTNP